SERGLEDGVHEQRAAELVAGLELREQAIDEVDVPGSFDLGDHDHLETVADLAHEARDVVEGPGAVAAVGSPPEWRVAEVQSAAPPPRASAPRPPPPRNCTRCAMTSVM